MVSLTMQSQSTLVCLNHLQCHRGNRRVNCPGTAIQASSKLLEHLMQRKQRSSRFATGDITAQESAGEPPVSADHI